MSIMILFWIDQLQGETFFNLDIAQSAGAVEYTDSFSAEVEDPHHQRVS